MAKSEVDTIVGRLKFAGLLENMVGEDDIAGESAHEAWVAVMVPIAAIR